MQAKKEKKDTKEILIASNLFSGLGSATALCCTGPGIVACSMTCAPSCGAVGFSFLGISSSALTIYIEAYWFVFLILSILCFMEAFYRLFLVKDCANRKGSKIGFVISLLISIVVYTFSFFGTFIDYWTF